MWWWTLVLACDRGPDPPHDDVDNDGTTTEDSADTGSRDDTDTTLPEEGRPCPEPAWARVVGGEGADTLGFLGTTHDGALAVLGGSEPTDSFDVGDGPIPVGWTSDTAWVAVFEEDDGALRWLTPIAIQDAPTAGFGLFALAGPLDSGVVAAGQLRTDGVLAPGSSSEQPASAMDGFVVRLSLEGVVTRVLAIQPDAANGAALSKLLVATSSADALLLSGGGEGVVTFSGTTVDLGEGGMFVAELAPDLSVSWVWHVGNASPEAAVAIPAGWLAAGSPVDPELPVTPLPYGPVFESGFVVELDVAGLATQSTGLVGSPSALWSDTYGDFVRAVVSRETLLPESTIDLEPVTFGLYGPFPAPLMSRGPALPLADVAQDLVVIGGLAQVVEAPFAEGPPLREDLPTLMSTTTLMQGALLPICIVVTDAMEVVNPDVDGDGDLGIAGVSDGTFTVDVNGPEPLTGTARAGVDGFVARLSSTATGYR
jgi:hypothetical protein